jgi:hypothetical protein
MDLELDSNELQAATDEASRSRLKDLDYQTSELNKRVKELDGERGVQIGELAAQVKNYRELIQQLETEGAISIKPSTVRSKRCVQPRPATSSRYPMMNSIPFVAVWGVPETLRAN